jgi:hypothetical protein
MSCGGLPHIRRSPNLQTVHTGNERGGIPEDGSVSLLMSFRPEPILLQPCPILPGLCLPGEDSLRHRLRGGGGGGRKKHF